MTKGLARRKMTWKKRKGGTFFPFFFSFPLVSQTYFADLWVSDLGDVKEERQPLWRWGSWVSPVWSRWRFLWNEWRNSQKLNPRHTAILLHISCQTPSWCEQQWTCNPRHHRHQEPERRKTWPGSASWPACLCLLSMLFLPTFSLLFSLKTQMRYALAGSYPENPGRIFWVLLSFKINNAKKKWCSF